MKQAVLDLINKLLSDVQALPEDPDVSALQAQIADLTAQVSALTAKLALGKTDAEKVVADLA